MGQIPTQPPPRPGLTANREGAKRHTPDRPGCTRPHQHEVHGRPRCQRDINGLLSGQRHERRILLVATSVNRQFADSLDNNEKKRAVAAANIRFDANQKEKGKQTALGTSAMAATAVVLQHLHLHYITVATYHHYSLFHHLKEGQPPAYRKQQTGNTDPHYPAARPEPPQRTTDGRNRTGHGYQ